MIEFKDGNALEDLQNIKMEMLNAMHKINHNVKKITDIINELEKK